MAKKGYRKFFSRKFTNSEGTWDSKTEYERWLFLKSLADNGEISDLRRQVKYEIIPKQTYTFAKQLKTKVKYETKTLEQPAYYTADFVYRLKDGKEIVEDVKSVMTRKEKDYVLRRKLMVLHGHLFHEVVKVTQPIPVSTEIIQ